MAISCLACARPALALSRVWQARTYVRRCEKRKRRRKRSRKSEGEIFNKAFYLLRLLLSREPWLLMLPYYIHTYYYCVPKKLARYLALILCVVPVLFLSLSLSQDLCTLGVVTRRKRKKRERERERKEPILSDYLPNWLNKWESDQIAR